MTFNEARNPTLQKTDHNTVVIIMFCVLFTTNVSMFVACSIGRDSHFINDLPKLTVIRYTILSNKKDKEVT
uniref:Uncharacterized protein n=2 Tax=Amphimedon queenslandica TaxID=400682 RepID=A0A1X7TWD3_AMPQE